MPVLQGPMFNPESFQREKIPNNQKTISKDLNWSRIYWCLVLLFDFLQLCFLICQVNINNFILMDI
jgi:hypothetical protein